MAGVLRELKTRPAESKGLGGSISAVRRFRYSDDAGLGVTVEQARGAAGVPALGSAHPSLAGAVASNLSFLDEGRTVEITVTYGDPERNQSRPPLDPLDPAFQSMSISYREDEVEFPVYSVVDVTMEDGENSSTVKKWWTQAATRRVIKTVHEYTYRLSFTFPPQFNPGQWMSTVGQSIQQQANKLHKFNGVYFLYKPGSIQQQTSATTDTPARWSIEHRWSYDPGLDVPRDPTGALLTSAAAPGVLNLRTYYTGALPSGGYIPTQTPTVKLLQPWTTVDVNADVRGPEFPPIPTFYLRFTPDDNGWQSLPGIA